MGLSSDRAQSIGEYVVLLAVLASVVISMQFYVRRGLQARLRQASDYVVTGMNRKLGSNYNNQYEPYYRESNRPITTSGSLTDRMFFGGQKRENSADTLRVPEGEYITETIR